MATTCDKQSKPTVAAVSTCQDTSLRSYFSPGHAELSALEARRDKARFYDKKPVPWQRKNIACFISPVFSSDVFAFRTACNVTFKFCEFNLDSWSILFRSMVLSPQKAFLFIIPAYSCVIQGASILSQSSRALAAKAACRLWLVEAFRRWICCILRYPPSGDQAWHWEIPYKWMEVLRWS